MSQAGIIKLLKRNPDKWFTTKEISERLKINRSSISMNIQKMSQEIDIICSHSVNPKGKYPCLLIKYNLPLLVSSKHLKVKQTQKQYENKI